MHGKMLSRVSRWWSCCSTRDAKLSKEVTPADEDDYPVFPPAPPREILEHRTDYARRVRRRRYGGPLGETVDQPIFALYRLYEHIMTDNNIGMRNELEAFWWKQWPVSSIPDPKDDKEPERYAVLASIPALLVESFNHRQDLGLRRNARGIMSNEEAAEFAASPKQYETEPSWAAHVEPLKTTLHITHTMENEEQLASLEDVRAAASFKARNVMIWKPHIHFV